MKSYMDGIDDDVDDGHGVGNERWMEGRMRGSVWRVQGDVQTDYSKPNLVSDGHAPPQIVCVKISHNNKIRKQIQFLRATEINNK